jgi:hypothetical protein
MCRQGPRTGSRPPVAWFLGLFVASATIAGCTQSPSRESAKPKQTSSASSFVPPDLQLPQSLTLTGSERGDMRSARVRPVCSVLGPVTSQPPDWETSIGGLVIGTDDIPWLLDININPFVGPGAYSLDIDTPAGARLFPSPPNTEYFDAVHGELSIDQDGLGGTINSDFISDGPTPGNGSPRSGTIHVNGHFVCGVKG